MKKIFFSLSVLLFASNCVLIDSLGLNVVKGTIKGSEAKSLILSRAVAGAAASGNSTAIASSIATYNTKGLKDSKYYDKADVDDCADKIIIINFASSSTGGISAGQLLCQDIHEQKMIIDWPIPLL